MKSKMKIFPNNKEKYYNNIKNLLSRIDSRIDDQEDKEDIKESESQVFDDLIEKCQRCHEKTYKYTCPKCSIKYCSVECYKSHNKNCTESFYKDQVEQELKSQKVSEDEGKKFRKTLKDYYGRLHDSNILKPISLSEDRKKHLEALLKKIENDSICIEKDLLPDDWNEFNKFLSGYAQNSFTPWKPFWLSSLSDDLSPSLVYNIEILKQYDEATLQRLKDYSINDYTEYYNQNNSEQLIENYFADMNIDDISIELNGKILPLNRDIIYHSLLLKYNDIKPLEKLSKVRPNENIIYTLVNIISNVVYIFKLYNGEVNENVDEIVNLLFENCKILYERSTNFTSVQMALDDFFTSIFRIELKHQKETRQMIKEDLIKIFSNKFLIFEAFIRLYELIHGVKRKEVTLAKHKLIYLLSYIKDQGVNERIITEINNY
jgi:hypothetical protein